MQSQVPSHILQLLAVLKHDMNSICVFGKIWVDAQWVEIDEDGDKDYILFVDTKGGIHYGLGWQISNSSNMHLGGNHQKQGCSNCDLLANQCHDKIIKYLTPILQIPNQSHQSQQDLCHKLILEMNKMCQLQKKWRNARWINIDQDGDKDYIELFDESGENFYGLKKGQVNGYQQHLGGNHQKQGCDVCQNLSDNFYESIKNGFESSVGEIIKYDYSEKIREPPIN